MDICSISNSINTYSSKNTKKTSDKIFEVRNSSSSSVKESNSSDNGKKIGVTLIGNQAYLASYADSSTPVNPVVKIGDYEVEVNKVNPENATELEMFALMSYLDDTHQTGNKGICSFGKMRAFADFGEMANLCTGISEPDAICNKKQDWTKIMKDMKQVFLGNSQTYKQALECDKLIDTMCYIKKRTENN